jgi:hypothetical protein
MRHSHRKARPGAVTEAFAVSGNPDIAALNSDFIETFSCAALPQD